MLLAYRCYSAADCNALVIAIAVVHTIASPRVVMCAAVPWLAVSVMLPVGGGSGASAMEVAHKIVSAHWTAGAVEGLDARLEATASQAAVLDMVVSCTAASARSAARREPRLAACAWPLLDRRRRRFGDGHRAYYRVCSWGYSSSDARVCYMPEAAAWQVAVTLQRWPAHTRS